MKLISVPKVLREKLGEDGVDALLELINLANEKAKEDIIEIQTEKYERRLSEEISKLRSEDLAKFDKRITEDLAKLDKRITEEAAKLDKRITEETSKIDKRITEEISKMDAKISNVQANLIKWMFIFWIGQIGAILGILFAFFK